MSLTQPQASPETLRAVENVIRFGSEKDVADLASESWMDGYNAAMIDAADVLEQYAAGPLVKEIAKGFRQSAATRHHPYQEEE